MEQEERDRIIFQTRIFDVSRIVQNLLYDPAGKKDEKDEKDGKDGRDGKDENDEVGAVKIKRLDNK